MTGLPELPPVAFARRNSGDHLDFRLARGVLLADGKVGDLLVVVAGATQG